MSDEMFEISVEDVIDQRFIKQYVAEREVIYERLRVIKNSTYIVEQIESFPFRLFREAQEPHFWALTSRAYWDSMVMGMWNLVSPSSKQYFTLQNFRNRVTLEYKRPDIRPEVRRQFEKRLVSVDFDNRIVVIGEKIHNIRNLFVGHLSEQAHLNPAALNPNDYQISLKELKELLHIAYELFLGLYLGAYPELIYWDYYPRHGVKDWYTDIEALLAFVASRSFYILDFEDDFRKEMQQEELEKLSDVQRETVEEWRQKWLLISRGS